MLKEMRMKSFKRILTGAVFIIPAAVLMSLGCGGQDVPLILRGSVPFEDLSMEELEGEYVSVSLDLTCGSFAEEVTTKKTQYGSTVKEKSSGVYHVILVGSLESYMTEEERWFEYAGIKIPPKYYDQMEAIENNSSAFS